MKAKNGIIKSKERVKKYGEVFTPAWVVTMMIDAFESNGNIITPEATVLEPACGEGAFLTEILARKLHRAQKEDNIIQSMIISLSTLYGIDIQEDNVKTCRKKLYNQFIKAFSQNGTPNEKICDIVHKILEQNIVCGNFLTKLDKNGAPIHFLSN